MPFQVLNSILLLSAVSGILQLVMNPVVGSEDFNVVYLGTINGKSYFSGIEPKRNWTEARSSCQESGMRLASIDTVEESALLVSASNNVTFEGFFWTAARNTIAHDQFVWDHNNVSPNTGAVPNIYIGTYQQCITYHVPPGAGDKIHGDYHVYDCALGFATLCEIVHGN